VGCDVRSFPVEIRNENEVWVDVSSISSIGVNSYYEMLLQNRLKQNTQLIIAKASYRNIRRKSNWK
jgi:hypothetical protein